MKYIILLLLSFNLCAADIWIQRTPVTEQTGVGYMFTFQESGVMRCWSMPDMLDINYVPMAWMKVPEAAIVYNWPFMIGDAAIACNDGPTVPRTMGGVLFTMGHDLVASPIMTIPNGVPCGDRMAIMPLYRAVTYEGNTGFALCI